MHTVAAATEHPVKLSGMAFSRSRAVTEYVRFRLKEYFREHDYHGAVAELARDVGIKGQHVGQIRDGDRGVGPDAEEGFAKVFAKGSVEALRRAAESWWSEQPESKEVERTVERDARYPNLGRAEQAARALGYSEEAIRNVHATALKSTTDQTPEEWLEDIKSEHRRLRRVAAGEAPKETPVKLDDPEALEMVPKWPPKPKTPDDKK